jgi:hypothetical protein
LIYYAIYDYFKRSKQELDLKFGSYYEYIRTEDPDEDQEIYWVYVQDMESNEEGWAPLNYLRIYENNEKYEIHMVRYSDEVSGWMCFCV